MDFDGNEIRVLKSDIDVTEMKNNVMGAKDDVSGLNMRCDALLKKNPVFKKKLYCASNLKL